MFKLKKHTLAAATKLIIIDLLFCLLYFWAALFSYTIWSPEEGSYGLSYPAQKTSFLAIVVLAEKYSHGPDILVLSIVGVISPLLAFLPLAPILLCTTKPSQWLSTLLFVLWLAEIFALGFLTPRVYPLLIHS